MKFHSDGDAKLFIIEVGMLDKLSTTNKDLKPTEEMLGLLKKKRFGLERGLKNFRKSQSSKAVWRKYGADIMRGIKKFHKSTEGKRFHRNLSRFLVRKEFTGFLTGKKLGGVTESMDFWEKADAIKAISSAKTHLFIEMEYYHPMYEQMALEEFTLTNIGTLNEIEEKILHDQELTKEDINLLFTVVETAAVVKSLADKSGKGVKEVEAMWDKIKKQLIDQGRDEDDENFFALLVGSLKNALKLD